MDTNTLSTDSVSASPSDCAGSIVTLTLALRGLTSVTFLPRRNLKPCFWRIRWNCFATSSSTPGVIRSKNSTTVTSAPRRAQTEPSSKPIIPAPTINKCFGTASNSSAPVDDATSFSSISTPRSGVLSEPVAITIFFVFRVRVPPANKLTSILPEATIIADPCSASTLFFLKRKSIP